MGGDLSALWSALEKGALRLAVVRPTPSPVVRGGRRREEASSSATALVPGSEREPLSRQAPSASLRGRSGWSPPRVLSEGVATYLFVQLVGRCQVPQELGRRRSP